MAKDRKKLDQMNRPPNEAELTVWKQKFADLADELVKMGLTSDPRRKLLVYLLKNTQANTVQDISAHQWENFFHVIDYLRHSHQLPALVQSIERLSAPSPSQSTPSFSAEDLVILHDAGISADDDVRAPSKYWLEK